jgi:hypothetical protein
VVSDGVTGTADAAIWLGEYMASIYSGVTVGVIYLHAWITGMRWEDEDEREPRGECERRAVYYAPRGECEYCDRRRAAAARSMRRVRERGSDE